MPPPFTARTRRRPASCARSCPGLQEGQKRVAGAMAARRQRGVTCTWNLQEKVDEPPDRQVLHSEGDLGNTGPQQRGAPQRGSSRHIIAPRPGQQDKEGGVRFWGGPGRSRRGRLRHPRAWSPLGVKRGAGAWERPVSCTRNPPAAELEVPPCPLPPLAPAWPGVAATKAGEKAPPAEPTAPRAWFQGAGRTLRSPRKHGPFLRRVPKGPRPAVQLCPPGGR